LVGNVPVKACSFGPAATASWALQGGPTAAKILSPSAPSPLGTTLALVPAMFTPSLTLVFLGTLSAVPLFESPAPAAVRSLPAAPRLEISGAFSIEVRPSPTPRLTILGPVEQVRVDARADRIQIGRVEPSSGPIHLLIELPAVESLSLSGAHTVNIPSLLGAHFQLTASGASQITLGGKVTELSAHLTGAVSLNAHNLEAQRVEVGAHGSSQAKVNVRERLGVDASGVSHVDYQGRPKQVVPKLSGLASVGTTEV
jgi:hypothetical protein